MQLYIKKKNRKEEFNKILMHVIEQVASSSAFFSKKTSGSMRSQTPGLMMEKEIYTESRKEIKY